MDDGIRPDLTLYDASVPVLRHHLERLDGLLDAAERHAVARGLAIEELLAARLAPDMYPLARQVVIAANFCRRAVAPLAGLSHEAPEADESSRAGLGAHIAGTIAWLDTIRPAQLDGAGERPCSSRAGDAIVTLPGREFLTTYALPNMLFHAAMAYAILRAAGVPLGKADWDGRHRYPAAG